MDGTIKIEPCEVCGEGWIAKAELRADGHYAFFCRKHAPTPSPTPYHRAIARNARGNVNV